MKLLIDGRTLGEKPSGIGMYLYHFAKGLARQADMELTILTDVCRSRELCELADADGVSVRAFGRPIRKGPDLWRYFRFLRRCIAEEKPEIFWEVNNLLPVAMHNPWGSYVVTIHDIFPLTLPEQHDPLFCAYFRYGLGKTVRCCDAVLFDCREIQREVNERFNALSGKPQFVSYAAASMPKAPDTPRQDFFLYLGNLEKRKGTDLLLDAYRLYRERGGQRSLVLAGKLRDREIAARLHRAEQKLDGLSYRGYVSDGERRELYQSCSCLLFPSRAEGFGIPVIEALDAGARVIASRLAVLEELAGDRVGWFELADGAEGLCEKLLADDAPSVEGWDNPFTAEKLVPELARFFRSLGERGGH